ncbi:uncharacterized protein BX664DRAFT_323353 [Halteromyces radiatus]|uniref:uncharacterized protein n=1 Tax=Halteromyces radiatus TaxID=101107 RepID=UPI00222115E0|nr:uncharacterized protein BX664DRAFT_323353 [Halteromyces radiatus]KAI8096195.1 hypothetical protein BX664DRAFT_323353 [Halteromyces radiatus]
MFRTLFTLMILVFTLVVAQQTPIVSITAPLQNAAYSAGQRLVISWINPQVDTISQIQICHGNPAALQPIAVIATNVNAKGNGSFDWTIPSNYTTGSDYAFILGTSPNVAYTGQFTINAATSSS